MIMYLLHAPISPTSPSDWGSCQWRVLLCRDPSVLLSSLPDRMVSLGMNQLLTRIDPPSSLCLIIIGHSLVSHQSCTFHTLQGIARECPPAGCYRPCCQGVGGGSCLRDTAVRGAYGGNLTVGLEGAGQARCQGNQGDWLASQVDTSQSVTQALRDYLIGMCILLMVAVICISVTVLRPVLPPVLSRHLVLTASEQRTPKAGRRQSSTRFIVVR